MCDRHFHSFYLLREHKLKELGTQTGSGAENFDVAHAMGDIGENCLKEELERCEHFFVDSKMENEDTNSTTLPWIIWIQNICGKK